MLNRAPDTAIAAADDDQWMDVDESIELPFEVMEEIPAAEQPQVEVDPSPSKANTLQKQRHILPNAADYRLYHEWMEIIPSLVDDYLHYTNTTMGERIGPGPEEICREGCVCHDERLKATTLTCLYVDCEWIVSVWVGYKY